ncbi:hypothetical protein [Mycetocola saprophilus]|uniref:hypothetical protein n=1 Tax=Mycetocola saprophilus TaxID=76636 RepID=UPI003BEFDEA3
MIIPKNVSSATHYAEGASHSRPQITWHPLTATRTSWALPVPDGAYSSIPAWNGRAHYLTALSAALRTQAGEDARRKISITHDTLMRIAATDAASADARTGREVTTAHDTVATALGMCKRTVQRGRELIQALGFAQVIVEGRYLTKAERAEAKALHGRTQRRAASVRALTLPESSRSVENVHLPRRGFFNPLTHVKRYSPKRALTRKTAARSGAITPKGTVSKKRPATRPEVAQIASELTTRLLFLGQWRTHIIEIPGHSPVLHPAAEHIGTICRIITRSNLDTSRLTGADIIDVLDRITAETGRVTLTGSLVKNPLGYLTKLLRQVREYIDRTGYTTQKERHQAAQERRAQILREQATRAAEREAERARANTPEAVAAREAFFAAWRGEVRDTTTLA